MQFRTYQILQSMFPHRSLRNLHGRCLHQSAVPTNCADMIIIFIPKPERKGHVEEDSDCLRSK